MSLTIGITTFSKRFDFLSKLLTQIRKIDKKNKIVICVNGEKDGNFDENYRRKVLTLCCLHENVFPVFFIETRGLSKMWNTIINTSEQDNILILNDDIEIHNENFFSTLYRHTQTKDFTGILRINRSFSHFLVNKETILKLGYFDERLLGFGEEDGDITYRLNKMGQQIQDINVDGVINIVSDLRHDYINKGIGKYSKYNRDFIYNEKYITNYESNLKGMFDEPKKQLLDDVNCYPMEKYFIENKNRL